MQSPKAFAMRDLARQQFRAGSAEQEPEKIKELMGRAEMTLSNYLLYETAAKDSRFQATQEAMMN